MTSVNLRYTSLTRQVLSVTVALALAKPEVYFGGISKCCRKKVHMVKCKLDLFGTFKVYSRIIHRFLWQRDRMAGTQYYDRFSILISQPKAFSPKPSELSFQYIAFNIQSRSDSIRFSQLTKYNYCTVECDRVRTRFVNT